MAYQDWKEFYNDIKTDKFMKWTIRIGLVVVFTVSIICFIHAYNSFNKGVSRGEHVKFLSLERNMDRIHDTVQKVSYRDTCISKSWNRTDTFEKNRRDEYNTNIHSARDVSVGPHK